MFQTTNQYFMDEFYFGYPHDLGNLHVDEDDSIEFIFYRINMNVNIDL